MTTEDDPPYRLREGERWADVLAERVGDFADLCRGSSSPEIAKSAARLLADGIRAIVETAEADLEGIKKQASELEGWIRGMKAAALVEEALTPGGTGPLIRALRWEAEARSREAALLDREADLLRLKAAAALLDEIAGA